MKWSKQWVAALLLAPSMYLASCGGSDNNQETSDTLTTQSAPPVDANSSASPATPATDSSTTATVGEGGSNTASGSTSETTTSPGNVAATGSTSKTTSTSSTTSTRKKQRKATTKKYNVNDQSPSTTTEPASTTDSRTTNPVTRTEDDADSSTLKKSLMDTSSSVTTTDTTGEDMRNMDSTGMNRKSTADSAWNKTRVSGDSSTTDSVKSTLDTTSGIRNIDSAGAINSTKVGDTSLMDRTTGNTAGMNFTPSSFISTQIQNNYGEIKMARLAVNQSTNSDVLSIAKTLENDHNQALQELKNMAKNQTDISASLPTAESDSAKQHITMMQNSRGSDFDKVWVSHMHEMHERSVQNYEMAEGQITDPALKSWITKMLPKLREHRDKLAQLDRNINK